MRHSYLCLLALVASACQHAGSGSSAKASHQPEAAPTGIAAFAHHEKFINAKISPNGTYLAAIARTSGRRVLAIIDLKSRKMAAVFRPTPQQVGEFIWANDERLVVALWDDDGVLSSPVNYGELYGVTAKTGVGLLLRSWGAEIFGRLPNPQRGILIETFIADAGNDWRVILARMDAYNGATHQLAISPIAGADFITDEFGAPRIAYGSTAKQEDRFFYRDDQRNWIELGNLKGIGRSSLPVRYVSRSRTIDLVEPLAKGFGLYALNIDTGDRKLLSKNEWSPPSDLLVDAGTGEVLAVEYSPDLPAYEFLAPDHPLSRTLRGLLAAYPDEHVRITSATDDAKQAIALVYSDRDPGRFLLVDTATMSAEEIVSPRPWIDPHQMSEMTAFHIPASDGVWIHGYLTMPRTVPSGQAAPLVVLPHGGPHGVRDEWSFQPEVQLLAQEGFAVLQVNYRGSGGFGRKYQEAGYTHWGDRVVQDIVDATRYTIRKGFADARRVCIYGASFGGYAAMQSAILAPDLFRCAVGYAGIYDLDLMSSEGDVQERRSGRGYLRVALGTDEGKLKSVSPVYNANKLHARVLLIHGKKDKRAPIEHAERLKEALEKAGNPPEWLVEPHEAHGFYDEDARDRMYGRLVSFLRENTSLPPP